MIELHHAPSSEPAASPLRTHGARLMLWGLLGCLLTEPALGIDGERSGIEVESRLFQGLPHRVAIEGRLAYVALDTGLQVLDLSDPRAPRVLGTLYLPGPAFDLTVAGGIAYVAAGEAGLWLIDVSDPSAPEVIATVATSSPARPEPLGDIALPSGALDLAAGSGRPAQHERPGRAGDARPRHAGPRLAAVAEGTSVHLLDVADADEPRRIARLELTSQVQRLMLRDRRLYVTKSSGLEVYDLATPSRPVAIGGFAALTLATGFAIDGDLAMVAAGPDGVRVIDISLLDAPRELAALDTSGSATNLAAADGTILVAALEGQHWNLSCRACRSEWRPELVARGRAVNGTAPLGASEPALVVGDAVGFLEGSVVTPGL